MTCPRDTPAGQGRSGMSSLTSLPPPPARSRLPGFGPFCPGAGGPARASGAVQHSGAFSDAVLTPGPAGWGGEECSLVGVRRGGSAWPPRSISLQHAVNRGHQSRPWAAGSDRGLLLFQLPRTENPSQEAGGNTCSGRGDSRDWGLPLAMRPPCPGLSRVPDTVAGAQ